jgi:hypothetical protein
MKHHQSHHQHRYSKKIHTAFAAAQETCVTNEQGVFTFTADDRDEIVYALKEIFQTPLGKDYVRNFRTKELEDSHLEKILGAAQVLAGGEDISVQDMERGLELLISSGSIAQKNVEELHELSEPEGAPEVPKDKYGRPLSESQLKYREYRIFSERATSEQVKERKRVDAGYRSYVGKQLRSSHT